MWLERLKIFTRTSIWKFTLAFTFLVLILCSVVLITVYQFTVGDRRRQIEQSVVSATQGFNDLLQAKNLQLVDLTKAIKDRSENSKSMVVVLNHEGQLVGNLQSFPRNILLYPLLDRFPVVVSDHLGDADLTIVVGTQIQTVYGPLVVGLFDDNQGILEQSFLTVSLLVLGVSVLITFLIGFTYNWRVMSRVTQIGELLAKVQSGKLHSRLPISKKQDEYDVISGQINQMLDEIDSLLSSITAVTDNIAHDLRTPLSRIHIYIDNALHSTEAGTDQERWYLDLLKEMDQVMDTFNAMLELSKLEKEPLKETKQCDLAKICQDVADLVIPIAEEKLNFQWSLVNNEVVEGDPNLMFRAIYNVVDNAINYTPNNGLVRMLLIGRTLIIEDNGPGIPDAEKEKVFQRLYRLDKSRKSKGFGMGLSIVKAIVTQHGGELQLEDNHPGLKVTLEW
jgi:signal transduction histidine kinase